MAALCNREFNSYSICHISECIGKCLNKKTHETFSWDGLLCVISSANIISSTVLHTQYN